MGEGAAGMPAREIGRRSTLKGALSVGLASSGLGGCYRPCPPFGQWNNAVGTQSATPALIMFPTSAAELVGIVGQAELAKKRVRMTGSGHSFSDIALSDDYLLLPSRLDALLELDRDKLKPAFANDPRLVRTQCGITIRKLNADLDQRGLALENLGGYDGQTIAGVAMTATHGSGLHYGPIASQVVSLQLVTTGGKVLQLEPTDGMTDPKKFSGRLDEDPRIQVSLVQKDDWFDAAVVSMGCMGVVYSMVLRAVTKYWIRERRSIVPWSELAKPDGVIDRLVAGKKLNAQGPDPDHYEIYVNPYPTRRNGAAADHTCIYTERYRLDSPPTPTADSAKRGKGGTGHLLANPIARHLAEDSLRTFLDAARGDTLHDFHDSLLEYLEDDDYTDLSYKVFNLGDANRFRAYGIEMAFALEQTVAATERLFQLAAWNEAQKRNHGVPVSLRFVAPSRSPAAMQQGRATCMMEIGMLVGQFRAGDLLQSYETTFMREFGARPHWGLDLGILKSEAEVARLYPAWPAWKTVYAQLNDKGTFDGRVTDRLGISMGKR
jgi:FAD/FMN-containing dehydrogenase